MCFEHSSQRLRQDVWTTSYKASPLSPAKWPRFRCGYSSLPSPRPRQDVGTTSYKASPLSPAQWLRLRSGYGSLPSQRLRQDVAQRLLCTAATARLLKCRKLNYNFSLIKGPRRLGGNPVSMRKCLFENSRIDSHFDETSIGRTRQKVSLGWFPLQGRINYQRKR